MNCNEEVHDLICDEYIKEGKICTRKLVHIKYTKIIVIIADNLHNLAFLNGNKTCDFCY